MVEAGSKQFVDYTIVRIEKATFTQFLGKDLSGNEASTLVFYHYAKPSLASGQLYCQLVQVFLLDSHICLKSVKPNEELMERIDDYCTPGSLMVHE